MADPKLNLKLTTRAHAMDRYVDAKKLAAYATCKAAGVSYSDEREHWDRLRNYEIEARLWIQSQAKGDINDVWIVIEWCPFNGIHCRYFDIASIKDLKIALKSHRKLEYVAEFVLNDLSTAIELRGDRLDTVFYPEGFNEEESRIAV